MRVLAITNLYPNDREPARGLFNFEQLRALAMTDDVRVVSPLAHYPGMRLLGARATGGRTNGASPTMVHGAVGAWYPRYLYVPRLGQRFHDRLFYRGSRGIVRELVASGRPDVLLATWSYPDVVAGLRLSRECGVPFVAKVHGTDVNDYFEESWRRRAIVRALEAADGVVAVSRALSERLAAAGVTKTRVVYNGVDAERFAVRDRGAARALCGVEEDTRLVLFVGNLKPVKAVDDLLTAFARVSTTFADARLVIVGRGPLDGALRAGANERGLSPYVRFEGERTPDEVARWMNAADVLCLPSLNEGIPNVLLEAAASGLPVVASNVGGIPEVVSEGESGFLVEPRDPAALAEALTRALGWRWNRVQIRGLGARFTWKASAANLRVVLASAGERRPQA